MESVRCQRKSAIANGGFASIPPIGMADFRLASRKGASPGEGAWHGIRRAGAHRSSLRSALRSFGDRGATFCPVVVSSCCRLAAEGGGFSRRTDKDDTTTGRHDDRIAPARLRDEGDDFSSSRQLVVSSSSRSAGTSPRAEFAKCSFQVGGCEFNGHTAKSKEINHG